MLLLPLAALLAGAPARADGTSPDGGPPALLWVELPDDDARAQARALGLGFAEGIDGSWVLMDGPADSGRRLDRVGLAWRPAAPSTALSASGYHDPEQMVEALQELAEQAPDLVQLVELGHSVEGRPLVALSLGVAEDPRVGWRLVGTHHGNEGSGAELGLETARQLVQAWISGEDPELAALLERDQVWVIPHLNPDGVARGSRYNAHTVDLNRNYGYRWSSSEYLSGDAPFSEPETRALRALHAWTPVAGGLSFHSGAANIGWVWNYTTTPSPDDTLVQWLAQAYADACTVPGFWLTNGAEWYITYGDTTDWAYGHHGALDFTLEASVEKTPPADQLPTLMAQHWPGVRAFLLGPDSVAGQIVDASTGQGIPALVTPSGSGWPQLTGPQGRFARLVAGEETLSFTVSAPGYDSAELHLEVGADRQVLALEPAKLVALRATPTVISDQGELRFSLDEADGHSLRLRRPGFDPVPATLEGSEWTLPAGSLAPGPWDLELDGAVAPRALLVADDDEQTRVDAVELDDDGVALLSGQGFGLGSRAWVLSGSLRALQPVAVIAEDQDRIELDLSPWRSQEGPLDLVVLSAGHQLAVADVLGDLDLPDGPADTGASSDSASPSPDSGAPADGVSEGPTADDEPRARGCGCSSNPSSPRSPPPHASAILLLISLLSWRRRSQT